MHHHCRGLIPRLMAGDCHATKTCGYLVPSLRYELYLPLHELWKKYMEDLLQIGRSIIIPALSSVPEILYAPCAQTAKPHLQFFHCRHTNQSQLNQKVLKADYHGSLLTG